MSKLINGNKNIYLKIQNYTFFFPRERKTPEKIRQKAQLIFLSKISFFFMPK